jgi:hypothetical protein
MHRLLIVALLGVALSPALADETPCYREIGSVHIPAFANASPSELQAQARCLILEYSVWPKAQYIPSPTPNEFASRLVLPGAAVSIGKRPSLTEMAAPSSFHLGPATEVLATSPD